MEGVKTNLNWNQIRISFDWNFVWYDLPVICSEEFEFLGTLFVPPWTLRKSEKRSIKGAGGMYLCYSRLRQFIDTRAYPKMDRVAEL